MKSQGIVSTIIAIISGILFTVLLFYGRISEFTYAWLLSLVALVCVSILLLNRLKILDLKELRLTLNEIKQVKEDIAEMYGGIANLRKQPLVLDDTKMKELGLKTGNPGALVTASLATALMRYIVGCFKRERERLAKIFINEKTPEKTATAILDNSLDDKVFKWNGPEASLDAEPKSAEEREELKTQGEGKS